MVSLALTIIVIGVLLYLANAFIPMDPKIKKILNIVVVLGLVLWILWDVGAFTYLDGYNQHVGHGGCGYRGRH
jgi:hypothetical protein